MARKLSKAGSKAAEAKAAGADDQSIMLPNRDVKIAGRTLTVHEYGFEEGLRLQRKVAPIIAALDADAAVRKTDEEHIQGVLADHAGLVIELIAESCVKVPEGDYDRDERAARVAELQALLKSKKVSESDGHLLYMTWWAVNGPFFVRRVLERRMAARIKADREAGKKSPGQTSTSASPSTASSGASTNSGDSPAAR